MPIQIISVKVVEIDKANDLLRIQVGLFEYPFSFSRFKELMEGYGVNNMDIEHLVRNMAIRCALSNISLDNTIMIKNVIEQGEGFKI